MRLELAAGVVAALGVVLVAAWGGVLGVAVAVPLRASGQGLAV